MTALPPNGLENVHGLNQNLLLAALSPSLQASISPHPRIVDLPYGKILAETGSDVKCLLFPTSGVISLVVELIVGETIETAMVGRDGV